MEKSSSSGGPSAADQQVVEWTLRTTRSRSRGEDPLLAGRRCDHIELQHAVEERLEVPVACEAIAAVELRSR
jgi:hypothetical protein